MGKTVRILFYIIVISVAFLSIENQEIASVQATSMHYSCEITNADELKYALDDDYIYASETQNGFYFVKPVYVTDGGIYETVSYDIMFCDITSGDTSLVYSIPECTVVDTTTNKELVFDTHSFYYQEDKLYYALMYFHHEYNSQTKEYEYVNTPTICCLDLLTGEITKQFKGVNQKESVSALGVDRQGRIYIASYNETVKLYSKEGVLIDETSEPYIIKKFCGFDGMNGNFYLQSYVEWDRLEDYPYIQLSMKAGNVSNNSITINDNSISYIEEAGNGQFALGSNMINSQYFVLYSSLYDQMAIMDSNAYNYLDALDNPSVYPGNITNNIDFVTVKDKSVVRMEMCVNDDLYYDGFTSYNGCRAVYNEATNGAIILNGNSEVVEYSFQDKGELSRVTSKHPVIKMLQIGNKVVLMEKSTKNVLYLEVIEWTRGNTMNISGPSEMTVGESAKLQILSGGALAHSCNLISSDSSILQVTKDGYLAAWKKGTVTIQAKSLSGGLQDTITITVKERSKKTSTVKRVKGVGTDNELLSYGNYVTDTIAYSYIEKLENGGYMRVENAESVVIEKYNKNGDCYFRKTLKRELPKFGGFYAGKNYYYLAFGQENEKESDTREVIRIVKYTKDWKRVSQCSVKGVDVYSPFAGGSLDMTEYGSSLYIHTAYLLYKLSDGLHHQANLTLKIDTNSMKLTDASTLDDSNLIAGFASHSFKQLIDSDEEYIYLLDHGDASPRGIELTRVTDGGAYEDMFGKTLFTFAGRDGDNVTGASIGDMQLSTHNVLVVGNYTNKTENARGPRNLFVIVQDKNMKEECSVKYLTDFSKNSNQLVGLPRLVKLDDMHFLLVYQVINKKTKKISTKFVLLDEYGNTKGETISANVLFSECNLQLLSNGKVAWYVSDGISPIVYQIDPYNLESVKKCKKVPVATTFVTLKGETYKFNKKKKTATLVSVDNNATACKIPNYLEIGDSYYDVTSINKNAFSKGKNIKKIVIGTEVRSIGAKAFSGCDKLKTLTIKTKKLAGSKLHKKAFKGIKKNVKIKVPKGKKTTYKKLFRKKGLSKKVSVK